MEECRSLCLNYTEPKIPQGSDQEETNRGTMCYRNTTLTIPAMFKLALIVQERVPRQATSVLNLHPKKAITRTYLKGFATVVHGHRLKTKKKNRKQQPPLPQPSPPPQPIPPIQPSTTATTNNSTSITTSTISTNSTITTNTTLQHHH
ncbi:unnamed protein product [Nesidiocoris tenuis]|uniref:Uncharacterized protein n=1 Tax=Nesidiocoris tenuis TaxID=355587 RepID=A0A6H5HVU0_9HEMI|nr:unnamed protein product [Nesidiocoris tenuis]